MDKICIECGVPFIAKHHRTIYCSPLCRSRVAQRKAAQWKLDNAEKAARIKKESARKYRSKRAADDPDWRKRESIRTKYNLSWDEYQSMISDSEGRCESCGNPADLQVDHDHACCPAKTTCGECVRGLLCPPCNRALGNVDDDVDKLRKLIDYLERKSL